MDTKISKKYKKTSVKKGGTLDKLAQLSPSDFEISVQTLRKRAKAKFFTNSYVKPLASLRSPLQKSYNNTIYGCSNLLVQTDKKITSHYCNNRWCIVCNRIRTAKLINGYKKPLSELNNKYFVTLTVPNVLRENLRNTIKDMIKNFRCIYKSLFKMTVKIKGIRKLECTYNEIRNDFHPHFHLIVSDITVAQKIVSEWLKRYPEAKQFCQDIRPCDERSTMELFKYFSKIITKDSIYIGPLDIIFSAMRNLRVYQPMGITKVTEDVDEIQSQVIEDLKEAEKTWEWIENDWVDKTTGECLTGYTPSDGIEKLIKNIK